MDEYGSDKYKSNFISWSDRIERLLVRSIKLLIILLILSQLILQFPAARRVLTTIDGSEGIPFHYDAR
ncbi:hypothetical protein [Cohnella sp. WQ 127256]|uniref:hypothetical protein n=1 Tax=Cohnella sp. WQ 127256 TaxID=2938790 RepID=UPI00211833E8|nr:hypothetical protein [Cohnella sp. WQ 127256]